VLVSSQLDRILGEEYLGELERRPIDDVRTMRAECQEIETGLSYLRRLVQGRSDIVGAELQRRRDGAEPGDLADLISQLPEILSDRTRAPGFGRLPQLLAPGDVDAELTARLDEIMGDHDLETLPTLSDDELRQVHDQLEALEREVSDRRRQFFDRIDTLQAEITRRYRTGEASVESLLQ
jgi:hypothetical protein